MIMIQRTLASRVHQPTARIGSQKYTLVRRLILNRSSNGPTRSAAAASAAIAGDAAASASSAAAAAAAPPPVAAVIFDVDGVLCSSEHLSREAAAEVMRRLHGLTVAPDEFIPFGGQGEARFLGGLAEAKGVANFDAQAASALFLEVFNSEFARGPRAKEIPFPGAVDFVRACRAAGWAVAVASSAERSKVAANLGAAGLDERDFGAVVSGTGGAFSGRNKPAPDIFLAAAAALGAPTRACVVLEDAVAGVAAARAAGMRVIGVATTLSAGELLDAGADAVVAAIGDATVAGVRELRYRDGRDGRSAAS